MIKSTAGRGGPALLVLGVAALALYSGQLVRSQGQPNERRTIMVNGYEAVAGEVLVRFNRLVSRAERAQMEAQVDAEESEPIAPNTHRLRSRSYSVATLVNYLRTRGDVALAEPNYVQYALATPTDPSFGNLWGLFNSGQTVNGDPGTAGKDISAKSAWDVSTGSTANVVAVVDTGIDYNHPDLQANIWSAPSDFIVNFGAGDITCAAGSHGFNAINNTCNPLDDHNHGTHVSGTIGARGNDGVGVVGVNWTASLMGAKFLSASGSGSTADAIKAVEFAIQAKNRFGAAANVRVLSNSWGGGGFSQALLDEINKANTNGMLFVASAGNSGQNTDIFPSYPASYTAANVVAVAASDNDDILASFSNYGTSSVDLAAPGVNVYSTTRNNGYAFYNGTSMAAPHVSGAAALVLAGCPSLTTAQLKAALLNNVDAVGGLATRVLTGGRLNVDKAIRSCAFPPGAPSSLSATPGPQRVQLSWPSVPGAAKYVIFRSTVSASYAPPAVATVTGTTYTDTGLTAGTTYYYVVFAWNSAGFSTNSPQASATPTGAPGAPTGVAATPGPGNRRITVSWNPTPLATSYTVRASLTSGGPYTTLASGLTSTSYQKGALQKGRRYYFVVVASNSVGSSPNSVEVNAVAP